MTYDPTWRPGDELVSGCPPPDDYEGGGVSPLQARRIVDAIEDDLARFGGPGLPNGTGRSGVPCGYGKYGDLA